MILAMNEKRSPLKFDSRIFVRSHCLKACERLIWPETMTECIHAWIPAKAITTSTTDNSNNNSNSFGNINTTTKTKADRTQSTKANCDRCQYSLHTHEKKPHTTDFDDGETWVQALHIGDWCVSVFVRKRKRQAPHKESMCYDVNTSMCIKTQTHGLENNIVHRPQRWSANDKRIFTWKMLVNSKNSYRISYRIDRYSILINTYRWFQIRFLENTNRCKNSIILLF